jgi:hypothetical protein
MSPENRKIKDMISRTQKTLKTEMLKTEIGKASLPITQHASRITQIAAPEWWALRPVGERRFLAGLARMMRSARRSKSPEVARAAAKWERALGCFIKVRLITERQKAECRMKRC